MATTPRTASASAFVLTAVLMVSCTPRRPADEPSREAPTDARALAPFDPAAVGRGAPPPPLPAAPLAALDVGPKGRSDGGGAIHIRFNQPVVALGDESAAHHDLLRVDPPLGGRATWQTPELLVFEPERAPGPARRYTVTLTRPIVGQGGQRFEGPLTWTFETPPPRVIEGGVVAESPLDVNRRTPVHIDLSQPVPLAELRARLRARARPLAADELAAADEPDAAAPTPSAGAEPVAIDIQPLTPALARRLGLGDVGPGPDRSYLVTPRGLWPRAAEVTVDLDAGYVGALGPLAADTPWSTTFRTYRPQALAASSCGGAERCPLEPITLTLRNQIHRRDLAKIQVTPRPRHFSIDLMDDWDNGYGREITLQGAFLPGKTYRIRLDPSLRDRFGQTPEGALEIAATIDRRPTLDLSSERGSLPPNRAQTIGATTRHIREVEVRAALLDEASQIEILRDPADDVVDRTWPARPLVERSRRFALDPRGPTDFAELTLDLADLVGQKTGVVLVEVRATALVDGARGPDPDPLPPQRAVINLSDLTPLALVSLPKSMVQVVRSTSGVPVAGASITLHAEGPPRPLGGTDGAGWLSLPVLDAWSAAEPKEGSAPPPKPATARRRPALLVAHDPATGDRAFLPLGDPGHPEPASPLRRGEVLRARLVSERDAYRPDEKVKVVGWAAIDTPYARSGLRRPAKGTEVRLELLDPNGEVIEAQTKRTNREGKFWGELKVPAAGRLGRHTVRANLLGGNTSAAIKVEDFRAPEYQVEARALRPDHVTGDAASIRVDATYFFGGPVPIESLRHQPECTPLRYRPPGLEPRWQVGRPLPWSRRVSRGPSVRVNTPLAPAALGHHVFELATGDHDGHPQRCSVSVEVRDASLQAVGAVAEYLVHPAPFYLAVARPDRSLQAGDRHALPLRAVDLQGARVAAERIHVKVERTHDEPIFRDEGGRQVLYGHRPRTDAVTTCTLDLRASGDDRTCALPPLQEGTYTVHAEGHDGPRRARTEASFWVRPRPQGPRLARWVPPATLTLTASADTVRPGETLTLTVGAPWPLEPGVILVERAGIQDHVPFTLEDGRATVELEADDTWAPGVHFEAYAVRPDRARPRLVRAATRVQVPLDHRRLAVAVAAPAEAGPAQEITIDVDVRDDLGRPAAARLALWAVDEAVLSLTNYEVPDLLEAFRVDRGPETRRVDAFDLIRAPFSPYGSDPWLEAFSFNGHGSGHGYGAGGMGMGSRGAGGGAPPPARSRFDTTPLFLGDVAVGADGRATVKARLPDDLTTFRVTAIASARLVDGESPGRFGVGDARVRVTKPLVLRAVLPRAMRPGDSAEIAAILQNRDERGGDVDVEVTVVPGPGRPPLRLAGAPTHHATLAAGDQLRVPFTLVADAPGTAELELRATLAGGPTDAVRLPLTVAAERTLTERVAAYGTLDDDHAVAVPVRIPADALPDLGGISVSLTSTLLGGLEDAVVGLIAYPHGCVEQTASRLLPLVAIADLDRIHPLGVDDVDAMIAAGVERILSMQTASGGFAYWPGGARPSPHATAYAAWILHLAQKSGHKVPEDPLDHALDYLESALVPALVDAHDPGEHAAIRQAIALHTLAEVGRPNPQVHAPLFAVRARLPAFARAFLLMALHRHDPRDPRAHTLADELLADLAETPAAAHVHERYAYDLGEYFASDGRADAIVLMALLRIRPDDPRVAKLARGLLDRRIGGAWRNTQENAYALVALADYARIHEAVEPDFVARAWVGRAPLLDAAFRGRDAAPQSRRAPMAALLAGLTSPAAAASPDPVSVILQREGAGRLYYRIGAEWAPRGNDLPARAQGLAITRDLRTRAGPHIAGQPLEPGDTVALDLDVEAATRTRYVAIDVPLPSGLEAVQRELGRGQRAMALGGTYGWWVSYEEQRRDRVVVYADDLGPGHHRHTLLLRATTPGRFTMPPATAEAMYTPELHGRSASATITVRSP